MHIEQDAPQPLHLGHHVERRVVDRRRQQPVGGMQTLDRELLFLVFDDHLVDAAGLGFTGAAVTHRRAGEGLEFKRYVLEHVAHPRAGPQPLEEAAPLSDRAAVLDHRGQPRHDPLIEAGKRVGGKILEPTEVDPRFEAGKRRPLIGAAEDLDRKNLHGRNAFL